MDSIRDSIEKIFKGAKESFSRFPASIISAVIISITAIIRISISWEMEKDYYLLFNSIQLAFLLAAVFSMTAVAYEENKSEEKKSSFVFANAGGIILGLGSFLLLYFFGGLVPDDGMIYLSDISIARISSAIFVSALGFVYIISKSKTLDKFSHAFFITHKAFVISAIKRQEGPSLLPLPLAFKNSDRRTVPLSEFNLLIFPLKNTCHNSFFLF